MARIENLKAYDPFADTTGDDDAGPGDQGLVHIRIQQRNGRKTLTTVQGLSSEYDFKKIVKVAKKEFACNGTVVEHSEYGEVIQLQVGWEAHINVTFLNINVTILHVNVTLLTIVLQGDQRENICRLLVDCGLVKSEQLKVHGF